MIWPHTNSQLTFEQSPNVIAIDTQILFDTPGFAIAYAGTNPGAWGSFPWLDIQRDLYDVILTYAPLTDGGFQGVLDAELELLALVRDAIDARN